MAITGRSKDIYQEVTDAVIEQMEKGVLVWHCGWKESGLPSNVTTGICYRGWNVFWLNFHTMVKSYPTPQYLTFKQALDLGGNIRKGEKGVKIIYWATIHTKSGINESQLADDDENKANRQRLVPKVYTVFNIAQAEGIIFFEPDMNGSSKAEKHVACEALIDQMPKRPEIRLNGQYPVYYPVRDLVSVPPISSFSSAEEYYAALFHELAHSTGHELRLGRKEITESAGYGSEPYSCEELTAELTATFLCALTGIGQQTIENSAAYLQGWLSALKNDKTLLVKAAGQAQKAADYIRNIKDEAA
ncbi:ArdC family protein [Mucilaginibacter terrae]|uniref:Antirestriction protein ArdC n=1 Tax=Mucilaginibacter terrae TaxID=1955052 RepID=A0ABU3GR86_9SPHI|nr:ArdC-like ssDNA-binding domain-containing protein [Mucilaginibacter terrae]MDT3402289.1 antirestriction protein ArdC [Mucilaginibacter terrae]